MRTWEHSKWIYKLYIEKIETNKCAFIKCLKILKKILNSEYKLYIWFKNKKININVIFNNNKNFICKKYYLLK